MSRIQSISAGFGALATLVVVGPLLAGSILSKPLPIASVQAEAELRQSADDVPTDAAALQRPRPVKLFTVAPQGSAERRYFFGRVAARQTINMAFQVGGELVEFPALEGQAVRRGDLLAKLDTGDYARAVERAELTLERLQRDLDRAATLARRDAAPEARAEDAKTERALAEVALREARDDLADATLTSPVDGIVAAQLVDNHTIVEPGEPVLRLHDLSEVRVEVDVPERYIAAVGDFESLAFAALLREGMPPLPLTLREYRTETEAIGQTYTVSLALDVLPEFRLLPGASAVVVASPKGADAERLAVPATAILVQPDESTAVMAFTPTGEAGAGTVELQPVKVRTTAGDDVIITAGLEPGQRIVEAGGHLLQDGQAVTVFAGFSGGGS